jgi:hypothetical protein
MEAEEGVEFATEVEAGGDGSVTLGAELPAHPAIGTVRNVPIAITATNTVRRPAGRGRSVRAGVLGGVHLFPPFLLELAAPMRPRIAQGSSWPSRIDLVRVPLTILFPACSSRPRTRWTDFASTLQSQKKMSKNTQ